MDAEVRVKFVLMHEVLATQPTAVLKLLVVCTMHLHVLLEVARCLEEFAAQAALKLILVCVHEIVAQVEVAPRKDLPAYLAGLHRRPLVLFPLCWLVLVDVLILAI